MGGMGGRAIALSLLVATAACGFDTSGGSPGGQDGAGDPSFDASPGSIPDGSGLGAPDGSAELDAAAPDPLGVLVDTIMVSSNGTPIDSNTSLMDGVTYRLVASGVVQVSSSGGGYSADAEYFWADNNPGSVYDGQGGDTPVDVGLAIDDPDVDGTKTPDWGAPGIDNTYVIQWPGEGAKITAQFHDVNPDNNAGDLTLEIYQTTL
jgi:hypothetical protein